MGTASLSLMASPGSARYLVEEPEDRPDLGVIVGDCHVEADDERLGGLRAKAPGREPAPEGRCIRRPQSTPRRSACAARRGPSHSSSRGKGRSRRSRSSFRHSVSPSSEPPGGRAFPSHGGDDPAAHRTPSCELPFARCWPDGNTRRKCGGAPARGRRAALALRMWRPRVLRCSALVPRSRLPRM